MHRFVVRLDIRPSAVQYSAISTGQVNHVIGTLAPGAMPGRDTFFLLGKKDYNNYNESFKQIHVPSGNLT